MNYDNNYSFDCPRCGEQINLEFSTCPKCGLNLYPQDDEELDLVENPDRFQIGRSVISIILGWIAGAGFVFLIFFIFLSLIATSMQQRLVISVICITGALISGLVSGFLIEEKPARHGFLVGLLVLGSSVFFELFWKDVRETILLQFDVLITWGIMLLTSTIGTYLSFHYSFKHQLYEFPENEYSLYKDLLIRVQNDHCVVECLLEYERSKSPHSERVVLLKNALERWKRDNRL